jgi:hypothetical protein
MSGHMGLLDAAKPNAPAQGVPVVSVPKCGTKSATLRIRASSLIRCRGFALSGMR